MGFGIAAADAPRGSITGGKPYLPASVAGDARDENTETTGAAAGSTGKGQRRARGTVVSLFPYPYSRSRSYGSRRGRFSRANSTAMLGRGRE